MILTGHEIRRNIDNKNIVCEPYEDSLIGANSIDVRLGGNGIYSLPIDYVIDTRNPPSKVLYEEFLFEEGDGSVVLYPNRVYLGETLERIGSDVFVPIMEGKSSLGRLGIETHVCAGFGDLGFIGYWTLEIRVDKVTKLYRGMKIGQIVFHYVMGKVDETYKTLGRYNGKNGVEFSKGI